MSACANCTNEAVFCVSDPGADPVFYCRACLPPHLSSRGDAGQLPLPDVVDDPDEPVTTAAVKRRK